MRERGTDEHHKKELFEIFEAGRNSNVEITAKEAFDKWLEKYDWHLFMSEQYNRDHQHRETCRMGTNQKHALQYYYPVGDTEHGCTCTGKLNRYLSTQEIYDFVLTIPDDKIALNSRHHGQKQSNGEYKYWSSEAYDIMEHIADFRGENISNCHEDKHCDGAFLERVMHFPGIGTYACGATFKFVERGEDPKFQEESQKGRILALLKAMMKYERTMESC